MATRKQRAVRQRRAQQHTRPQKPTLPAEWSSDQSWLAWTRDHGLDLRDRDQLLDCTAVGLTVLCWRNTVLEDVHASVERTQRLKRLGLDPNDPDVQAGEKVARRGFYQLLDANWDTLVETDPDESARMDVLLEGREQGFGIPDDVMMRMNISTATAVRDVLDEVLPESATEPDTDLHYSRRTVPDHVAAVVDLLQDPDRLLTVGGTNLMAGDILGDSWDEYTEDVYRKITGHLKLCDLIGTRRALWHVGLSGALYASSWFPNPWWVRAVRILQAHVADGNMAEAFYAPDRTATATPPDAMFWETLLTAPAELTGPQCHWVQTTRIRDLLHIVREDDRQRLGPLPDQERFPVFAAFF